MLRAMVLLPNNPRWAPRILCGALFAALAVPALAAPPAIAVTEAGLSVELVGHTLTMPPPVWTEPTTEPVDQAQTRHTVLAPGVESLVLLPMDATVITWTELMGILAINRPGYTAEMQLASVVDPISQACATGQLEASTVGTREAGAVLLACGRYKPGAEGVPHRCGGGIILATVLESPLGAAKIYHEWCTPTFDAANHDSWPVKHGDLAGFAELLIATAAFVPLDAAEAAN